MQINWSKWFNILIANVRISSHHSNLDYKRMTNSVHTWCDTHNNWIYPKWVALEIISFANWYNYENHKHKHTRTHSFNSQTQLNRIILKWHTNSRSENTQNHLFFDWHSQFKFSQTDKASQIKTNCTLNELTAHIMTDDSLHHIIGK